MSISKTDILTDAVERTGRTDVQNIDTELASILYDLSTRWPFLEKSDSVTIQAGGYKNSLPSDFRSFIAVVDSSDNLLKPIPSFPIWLALMDASSASGTSEKYVIFNEELYVYPPSTNGDTLTLYYSYYTNDVDNIAFPDHFYEAIVEGVCFKIFEAKSLASADTGGAPHKALYDAEINKLITRYMRYRHPVEQIEVPAESK